MHAGLGVRQNHHNRGLSLYWGDSVSFDGSTNIGAPNVHWLTVALDQLKDKNYKALWDSLSTARRHDDSQIEFEPTCTSTRAKVRLKEQVFSDAKAATAARQANVSSVTFGALYIHLYFGFGAVLSIKIGLGTLSGSIHARYNNRFPSEERLARTG